MLYQLPELTKYPELIHGFSTKEAGNMSFKWDKKGEVVVNRQKWLEELKLDPTQGMAGELKNEDNIFIVTKNDFGQGILTRPTVKADALITNVPGTFLLHVIADCASLLFYDPDNKVIALTHAGWQGTNANITKKVIETMGDKFQTNPKNLIVGIGPAIHQCCYAFKNVDRFTAHKWQAFMKLGAEDKIHVNLVGLNVYQLTNSGVPDENIFVSQYCTAHSDKFFSHYRDVKDKKTEARFAAVIGLK